MRPLFPVSLTLSVLALFACGQLQPSNGGDDPSNPNDAGAWDAAATNPRDDAGPRSDGGGPEFDASPSDAGGDGSSDGALNDAGSADASPSDAGGDGGTAHGAAKTILVTTGFELDIYDLEGNLLKSVPVPSEHREAGEGLRGVTEDPDGNVHIFAGTFGPRLATWDGKSWSSRAIGGTPNVVHYGHVVAVGDTVLSTTMNRRVTRYNRKTQVVDSVVGTDLADINKGGDGKLYGVDAFDQTVELDPVTLDVVRKLPISPSPDLIATDGAGGMHGAWTQSGTLFSFPVGSPATQGPMLGIQDLQDIDMTADGTFIFCGNGKLVIGRLGTKATITKKLPFNNSFCGFGYVAR